jgi:ribosomal protein S6
MNKYEALFILDVVGREDAEKDMIDRIQKDIEHAGGSVETVQKMGPKPFARPTAKRSSGHYVNVIFHAPPQAISQLDTKFHLDTELLRWNITEFVPEPVRKPRREPVEEAAPAATRR